MGVQTLPLKLTPSQAERRQRVIDAAMELGAEGGYDAVQMRDVAARAGVAMGTVYRYFKSKDHLLAAVLVHWAEMLERQLAQSPARGDNGVERVVDVLSRATRTMARRPGLVAAVMAPRASTDPAVIECQDHVAAVMDRVMLRAIGDPLPPDVEDRTRILGYVWYATLLGWVNGWSNVGRVSDDMQTAARLLLSTPAH